MILLGVGAFILLDRLTGVGLAREVGSAAGETVGEGVGSFLGSSLGAAGRTINETFEEQAPELSAGVDTLLDWTIGKRAPDIVGVNEDVLTRIRREVLTSLDFVERGIPRNERTPTDPSDESDEDYIFRTAKRCEGDGQKARDLGIEDLCPRLAKAKLAIAQKRDATTVLFFGAVDPSESWLSMWSTEEETPVSVFNP